jgi:hypothetical protein
MIPFASGAGGWAHQGLCSKEKGPCVIKVLRRFPGFRFEIPAYQLTGTVIFFPKRLW